MSERQPYLPAESSDLHEIFSQDHLSEVWARRDEAPDFDSLEGPRKGGAVTSIYIFANRQGQLVLGEIFQDGSRTVLWDFGAIES